MESEIDALKPGRDLDVLIETRIMGRKVKFAKGEPCAWDGDGKVIMSAPDNYILEDYNPAIDGVPVSPAHYNPKVVFDYSNYDIGMIRVMDRVIASSGLHEISISYTTSSPGWVSSVKWFDPGVKLVRLVHGHDEKYARLALYRGCLKAVLT
jgi:hypothetical protein